MTVILAWLTSKIAGPVAMAAAVALAIALAVASIKAAVIEHELRGQLATANASLLLSATNLSTCKANFWTEHDAFMRSQAGVQALQKEGATRTAVANAATAQARIATAALTKREAVIAAIKPTADACTSTFSLLTGGQ